MRKMKERKERGAGGDGKATKGSEGSEKKKIQQKDQGKMKREGEKTRENSSCADGTRVAP